jgi:glycopeptide antibiotics resistance protein
MSRPIAVKLSVAYLLVFLGLTLGGFYHPGATKNLVPFRTMEHDIRKGGWEFVINFVGNVVVTLPVGWIMPFFLRNRCSTWKVATAALTLSSGIEILQGLSGRRVADIDDVILNTVGGLVGYGFWVGVEWIVSRTSQSRTVSTEERLPTAG